MIWARAAAILRARIAAAKARKYRFISNSFKLAVKHCGDTPRSCRMRAVGRS
jgi:hypothetical protein